MPFLKFTQKDHGWCFGYTCMTRLSTFKAIVAPNYNYDIYLTSTPPDILRFRILNADSAYKIRFSMYYFTSMRIDVYKNGVYVPPTNAYYIGSNMVLKNVTNNLTSYMMPTHTSASGQNLFHNHRIWIAMFYLFHLNVPAMTPDLFFESATLVKSNKDS